MDVAYEIIGICAYSLASVYYLIQIIAQTKKH
jgi:hypothetical protein